MDPIKKSPPSQQVIGKPRFITHDELIAAAKRIKCEKCGKSNLSFDKYPSHRYICPSCGHKGDVSQAVSTGHSKIVSMEGALDLLAPPFKLSNLKGCDD